MRGKLAPGGAPAKRLLAAERAQRQNLRRGGGLSVRSAGNGWGGLTRLKNMGPTAVAAGGVDLIEDRAEGMVRELRGEAPRGGAQPRGLGAGELEALEAHARQRGLGRDVLTIHEASHVPCDTTRSDGGENTLCSVFAA